jgi:ABC-type antimicrobial peptide transport system permease subunit
MAQVDKSDETILSETLSAHRRQNRRYYNVSAIIISIFMLISSIGLGCCIYYTVISTPKPPSYKIGIYLLSTVIWTLAICLCMCLCIRRSTLRDLKMISINKTKPLIWRLDGNQWIK